MKLFGGREDNQEAKGHVYRMNEKLISIGDDYWIEDETGERAFYVDGKVLRIRNTLIFKDLRGNDLYKITEKLLRIRDTMEIKRADDSLAATVKKDLINILRDKWKVEISDGPDMEIHGNILDHEYEIESEGRKIAEAKEGNIDQSGVNLIISIRRLDNKTNSIIPLKISDFTPL